MAVSNAFSGGVPVGHATEPLRAECQDRCAVPGQQRSVCVCRRYIFHVGYGIITLKPAKNPLGYVPPRVNLSCRCCVADRCPAACVTLEYLAPALLLPPVLRAETQ